MGTPGDFHHILARICNALDRNTKILDLVNNNMMCGRPGAKPSITSSLTVQDADNESSNDESTCMTKPGKLTTRFKRCARSLSHKNPEEKNCQVSPISNNEYVVLMCSSDRFVNTQTN